MQAISLTQPWAQLVVLGAKRVETRSWPTRYRGEIAIHASKGFPKPAKEIVQHEWIYGFALDPHGFFVDNLPLGAIIGTVEITDCLPTEKADEIGLYSHHAEWAFGDYGAGRYMWLLTNPCMFDTPMPCKGALKIWTVPSTYHIVDGQIHFVPDQFNA